MLQNNLCCHDVHLLALLVHACIYVLATSNYSNYQASYTGRDLLQHVITVQTIPTGSEAEQPMFANPAYNLSRN